MEANNLEPIRTMILKVMSPKLASKKEIIEDISKDLDAIQNQNQLNLLQKCITAFNEYPDAQDDQRQILNEIRKIIKQKSANGNQDSNQIVNEMINKSQNGVGISILHNDGSFILTDQLTRKILEIKNAQEISKKLFEHCAIAGQQNLLKQFNEETTLLQQDEVEKQFQMTIYSEKTRKKALKHLNQASKKTKENILKTDTTIQKIKQPQQNRQFQNLDQWDKIKIKYLKTITIKITKVTMSVNDEFLDFIKNFESIYGSQRLSSMAENPTQIYNVVKCEISENSQFEQLQPEDIMKDQRLLIYEAKWQQKCQEISAEFQKLKRLKEEKKIQNRFQNLFIATQDQQYDLSSQIQFDSVQQVQSYQC